MTPVTAFSELVALEEVQHDRFATRIPGEGGHLFGGLTFALALAAATRSVSDDREFYAATCQYIGAGQGGVEVEIQVDRVRDGRKLSLRRARLTAGDRLLFTCDAWFAPEGREADWQPPPPPLDGLEAARPVDVLYGLPIDPFDVRTLRSEGDVAALRIHPFWARSRTALGTDRGLHRGALAFLSDIYTVGLMNPPGTPDDAPMSDYSLSLNHNLWVHRPARLDEWVRVDGQLASLHGDRSLGTGSIHAADGTLVASFAQEAMRRT